jgi:hypothetical protein
MKSYILVSSDIKIKSPDDIQVNSIYGIYQKRKKAIYEAILANKNKEYNIYEIDLINNQITNIFTFDGNDQFIDSYKKIHQLDLNLESIMRF